LAINRETSTGGVVLTTTDYCRRTQENHRNGQEESDIAATSEPYTPLRKEQGLRNCILNKSCQFSLIQCFLKFLFVQSSFHRECD